MPLYSYSRIGCFEQCPRKYKFQYIEKPRIDKFESVEAVMGKRVHETLEQCYKLAGFGRPPSEAEMVAYFDSQWEAKRPDNLKIVHEGESEKDYKNVGRDCLKDFHKRFFPFNDGRTLGTETKVIFALDDEGKYKLQGYIDRLTHHDDGTIKIQDYKTSKTPMTQPQADSDAQLALYQIAVTEKWPDNSGIFLVWHYLRHGLVLTSRRSSEQLEQLRQSYIEKIRHIEEATELDNFQPVESMLCDWCEYFDLCPAKGGPGVVADTSQGELGVLTDDERAALVDEFLDIEKRKKELEKRFKDIKEIFAEQVQAGSSAFLAGGEEGSGVLVTRRKELALPTKTADSEAVEIITDLVKTAGCFEDFADINIRSLQKALDGDELPPELRDRLKPLRKVKVSDGFKSKKV